MEVRRAAVVFLAFSFMTSSVWAGGREPFPTVSKLLASCNSANAAVRKETCDKFFRVSFMALMMWATNPQPGEDAACVEASKDLDAGLVKFRTETIGWFRKHPDTMQISADRAMKKAIADLYTCRAHR